VKTFTFTFSPKTQEVAYAGNIGAQEALQLLQQIVIIDAVNKAKLDKQGKDDTMDTQTEKEVKDAG